MSDDHRFIDGRDDLPFMIHRELDDIGLDPYEFRVYAHALRRAGNTIGGGSFYESVPNAAKHCRMDARIYRRSIARLVEMGLLAARQRSGKTTEYFITPKSAWLVRPPEQPLTDESPLTDMSGVPLADMSGVPLTDMSPEVRPLKGIPLKGKALSASPSASADTAARRSTSSPKKEAAASASLTPLPFSATASASPTPPSPKQAGSKSRQVDSQLLDALVATYNEHRTSDKGSLPQVRVRSPKLTADLTKFATAMQASGLDPLEALAALTSHLARNDHYLGKGGGTRYGLANALVNWHKHIDAALEAKAREQPQVKLVPGAVMTLVEGMHKETVRLLDAEPQDGLVRVERLRRRSDGVWVAYHESRVAVKNLRPDDPGRL